MKREESTSFDVFFVCFSVFGREKCVEKPGKEQNLGNCRLSLGLRGA